MTIWDELKVDRLAQNLQIRQFLVSDAKHAVFVANYADSAENVREVLVQVFLEDGQDSGERVNRFLEATYFQHPHILQYFKAGTLLSDRGTISYAITERADAWAAGHLGADEALIFAQHVLSSLGYLHARNLVYCVLSPDTVARVATHWKLADFSQLRTSGPDVSDEALSLAALDTSPPESLEGLISPAWDIWAFGQTLRKVLADYKANLPDPLRETVLACLHINPSSRPSLEQLSAILGKMQSSDRQYGASSAARA